MPTYEYLCQDCGERLEVFQSFSEKSLKKHPDCGGPLQKVFHASGVVFKGSGYYVTDSRSNGSNSSKSSESTKSSNGDRGKESKTKSESTTTKSESNKGESSKSESTKSESKTSSD